MLKQWLVILHPGEAHFLLVPKNIYIFNGLVLLCTYCSEQKLMKVYEIAQRNLVLLH